MADRLTIDVVWPDERKVRVDVVEREQVPPGDADEAWERRRRTTEVDSEPIESEDLESLDSLHARLHDLTIGEDDGAVVHARCWEGDDWADLLRLLGLTGRDRRARVQLDDDGG
jgi:hypothetical protein